MFKILPKILFCLLLIITTSHAAPFQNGSFEEDSALWVDDYGSTTYDYDELFINEQDLTGWTIQHLAGSSNQLIFWSSVFSNALSAKSGTYFIVPSYSSQMRLWQVFDTVIGQEYQVNFYMHRGVGSYTTYDGKCPSAEHKKILFTIKENNGSGTTLASFDGDEPNASWNQ
ncbi:MAG: hypothetical protein ACJAXL_000163, partial [Alphaproteobacteria bacterium]